MLSSTKGIEKKRGRSVSRTGRLKVGKNPTWDHADSMDYAKTVETLRRSIET
jgi:hypothetical protein